MTPGWKHSVKNNDEQRMGAGVMFQKHFNSEFWWISGNSCIDIPHVHSPMGE